MMNWVWRKIRSYICIFMQNRDNHCNISFRTSIYNTVFEGWNNVGNNCKLKGSSIGRYTYMGANCEFVNTQIGRFCAVASDVRVVCGKHPTKLYTAVHDLFYSKDGYNGISLCEEDFYDEYDYCDNDGKLFCIIGNDVWIGEGARILGGNKIGDGAIIAAGALVTKDVPSYAIVGGVPAKVIKYRFDSNEIAFLKRNPWWTRKPEWILKHATALRNIMEYKKLIENFAEEETGK